MKNLLQKRLLFGVISLLLPLLLFLVIRERMSWRPRILGHHQGTISEIVWSTDSKQLVSCDRGVNNIGGTLYLWSVENRTYQVLPRDGNRNIQFSTNNKITALDEKNLLRIYDASQPTKQPRTLKVAGGWVMSPDGQTAGGDKMQISDDLNKWIPDTLTLLRASDEKQTILKTPDMRSTALNHMAFSSDNQKFAAVTANAPGHSGPTLWVWNVRAPNTPQTIKVKNWAGSEIFFWPDNSSIAAISGSNLAIYDIKNGRQKFSHLFVENIALSPTGDMIAHGGNGHMEILAYPSLKILRELPSASLNSFNHPVAFSPDGRTLAVGETNGVITLWRVK